MKSTLANNVLTIVTGIKSEVFSRKPVLTVKDDKGNDVYAASKTAGTTGSIGASSIMFNNSVDGFATLVMILPESTTPETIKYEYAAKIAAANKFLPVLAAEVAVEEAELDYIMAELTEAE